MISNKEFIANGTTTRFLSDFIIRSVQYARPYVYIHDETLNIDGTEDVLQDPGSDWAYPTNLYRRGIDNPKSEDLVTADKWDVVDNSVLFYTAPLSNTHIWIEVATTSEEFGETLLAPTVSRAEAAADSASESEAEALASEGAAEASATASEASAVAAATSAAASQASAVASATSASEALASQSAASASETASSASETEAAASATASEASAVASSASETASALSATESEASKVAAVSSASSASTSETNAATSEDNAELSEWVSEAEKMTADSYATEAEDVFVKVYTSNGDGTFTATDTTEYSSLHWAAKSADNSLGAAVNIATNTGSFDGKLSTSDDTVQKALDTLDNAGGQIASSVITQGNIAIDATTPTKNFAAVTYTGNGATQDIVTGISSVDFTVASNGSGFWLDRTVNQVKNDAGVVQASGSCLINTSKVHVKERSGISDHFSYDGIRGVQEFIRTNQTSAEVNVAQTMTAFSVVGITVGSDTSHNENLATYIAYQTLYTHIKWGVTSQGKFQIEAYNPVTKEGMIYYLGSGNAGHQISHSQGVEIDYANIKNIGDGTRNWAVTYGVNDKILTLNTTGATLVASLITPSIQYTEFSDSTVVNKLDTEHIMYYKCKSETFTIGTYTGTGAAGNFVETLDSYGVARRPARVIIKAISGTGDWFVLDNKRDSNPNIKTLSLNTSVGETNQANGINILSNGIEIIETGSWFNGANIQYLYLVEFDTNGDGGDSYFPLPTDDTNLNLTGTVANYTNGKDTNGFVRSVESVTSSIDFAGVSDGFKWVAKEEGGSYNFYDKEPSVGLYEKLSADDNRLVFSDGKYYTTTGGELVTNGDFSDGTTTGWTAFASILSISNNTLLVADNGTTSTAYQAIATEVGESYIFRANVDIHTTTDYYSIGDNDPSVNGYSANTVKNISSSGMIENEFVATSTTTYLALGSGSTDYATYDNISVYKKEATLGTALTTPISLIPNPVMVQSETPMYIDYSRELSENVMESMTVDGDLEVTGNLSGMSGFDLGQQWVDVTSERASGATEINNTGKPMLVFILGSTSSDFDATGIYVDGLLVAYSGTKTTSASIWAGATTIVPPGSNYYYTWGAGIILGSIKELR